MGSHTKKTYGYQERDEVKRQEFREEIQKYKKESIVCIDEAGMNNRDDYAGRTHLKYKNPLTGRVSAFLNLAYFSSISLSGKGFRNTVHSPWMIMAMVGMKKESDFMHSKVGRDKDELI